MNKIICKRLEVIHITDILSCQDGIIIPKEGKKIISIPLDQTAIYQSSTQIDSAGIIKNETVTAKMKYMSDFYLFNYPLCYYVLQLYTDSKSFVVGSIEYPTELTQNDDKLILNLTFKGILPVL